MDKQTLGKDRGSKSTKSRNTKMSTKTAPKRSSQRASVPKQMNPTREQIAERAYSLWQENGRIHGRDMEDWLEAEKQLSRKATKSV